MNKKLEELENYRKSFIDGYPLIKKLIPVLEDFEKRLIELEKDRTNILEHYEINETDGVNNIKITLDDPGLKEKGD